MPPLCVAFLSLLLSFAHAQVPARPTEIPALAATYDSVSDFRCAAISNEIGESVCDLSSTSSSIRMASGPYRGYLAFGFSPGTSFPEMPVLPSLSNEELWYNLSFSFRSDPSNTFQNVDDSLELSVLFMGDWRLPREGEILWSEHPIGVPVILEDPNLTQDDWYQGVDGHEAHVGNVTEWQSFSINFKYASACTDCGFLIRLVHPEEWIADEETVLHWRDISLTCAAIPLPPVTNSNPAPEVAGLFVQPSAPVIPPRSDCPHLQAGLSPWGQASTWGGSTPPTSGDVVLPANTRVLIDAAAASLLSGALLGSVTVPATSQLILDDTPIDLSATDIIVEGQLHAGSATCPLDSAVTINLRGTRNSASVSPSEQVLKGIVTRGATASIDLHGTRFFPTWTRLSSSELSGSRHLRLADSPNWEVGMQIAITTTTYYDRPDTHENEVRTIEAISGRDVYLNEPLAHFHYGGEEYQAEVALLSRRIVVQGAEADSSQEDGFGGQIIVTQGASGRFTGVLARRMGQRNIIGRYPFHWHLNGESDGSYVVDSAIWESYYRCVTLHGTHQVLVSRNVAYDVTGHCYYLEDGIEEDNTLSYNLAALVGIIGTPAAGYGQGGVEQVEADYITQPADITASGFYITNAKNTIIGNTASGGWAGFTFPNLAEPIGSSRDVDISPETRPLTKFQGNTCHSSGYYWWSASCIYVGGRLRTQDDGRLHYMSGRSNRSTIRLNEDGSWAGEGFMLFEDTLIFAANIGLGHWGDRSELFRLETHDVARSSQLFGHAQLSDSLINAASGNAGVASLLPTNFGFEMYDTWTATVVSNVEFRNFNEDHMHCVHGLEHSDVFKPQSLTVFKDITFTNCRREGLFERYGRDTGSSRLMNLLDWTGSFTHWESGPAIIGALNSWWTHPLAVCFADEAWNMTACEWDMELTDVGSIWWDIADLTTTDGWSTEGPNPAPTIGWLAHFGTEGSADPPIPMTEHPLYSGFTGQAGWFAYYDAGSPEVIDFKDIQIRKGQFVLYASNYPVGTTFDVSVSQAWGSSDTFHVPLVSASEIFSSSEAMGPAEDMQCPNLRSCDAFAPCFTGTVGPAYHVDDNGTLYIRFVDMHHYVRGLSLEDTDFTRDGTSLPRIEQQFQWALRASCPDATRTTTANNAFCSASATIPNPMNFGPPPAPPDPPTIPALQSFTVEAETAGTTVTFPTAYASTPVVVCTVIHQDGWDVPVVSSLSTSGFVVSLLTSSRTVHCIAAKSGSSTMESDGIELEAFTVSVPSVSRKNSYILEEVAWPRSMADPVVVGQAYASSATVPRPTVFYSASVDKIWNPPVATQASFRVGTLQGECSDAESGPTTVGVIITPKGSYDLSDGTRVAAVVTRDRFVGTNKKAKRASAAELAGLRGDGAPLSVAMSPAAIDGADGYAAVLAAVPTSSRVTAFALEDTCGDSEMWHVSEQIALLMMEAPATAARRLEDRREPMRT